MTSLHIQADTSRVIWSYHSRDPSNEEELNNLRHERMGSASLNLLGGLNEDRVEENSQSFTILNDNVCKLCLQDTVVTTEHGGLTNLYIPLRL